MIVWLIGLSGAGKTTIGRELLRLWRQSAPNTVMVDGDEIRALFAADRSPGDYDMDGRRRNSDRIVALSRWLDGQQMNAVVCVLSIFEESRAQLRDSISGYFEVFVDVPMDVLERRDPKGLYAAARAGRMPNVVGVDIPFERPGHADLVIDNSADGIDAEAISRDILRRLGGLPP